MTVGRLHVVSLVGGDDLSVEASPAVLVSGVDAGKGLADDSALVGDVVVLVEEDGVFDSVGAGSNRLKVGRQNSDARRQKQYKVFAEGGECLATDRVPGATVTLARIGVGGVGSGGVASDARFDQVRGVNEFVVNQDGRKVRSVVDQGGGERHEKRDDR